MLVVLANAADLCTFYLVAQIHPIAGETNPIIAPLWAINPLLVALAKAAAVIMALLIIGRVHHRIARWGTAIAVGVPAVGMLVNTAAGLL